MRIESIADHSDVHALLMQVKAKVSDMREVMATIGDIGHRSIRKNFQAGGRPKKWPASNRVKADGGQTLALTGILKNSITVLTTTEDSVDIGTSDQRARVLNDGAKKGSFGTVTARIKAHKRVINQAFGRVLETPQTVNVSAHTRQMDLPWGDIPAREFMMLQDEDWVEIMAELKRFIERRE